MEFLLLNVFMVWSCYRLFCLLSNVNSSSIILLWSRTRKIPNKHIPNSLTTLAGWWGIIPKYDIISLLSLASRLALASYFSSLSSPFQPLVICLSTRHNFSCSQVRLDINERGESKLLNNVYLELQTGTLVNIQKIYSI